MLDNNKKEETKEKNLELPEFEAEARFLSINTRTDGAVTMNRAAVFKQIKRKPSAVYAKGQCLPLSLEMVSVYVNLSYIVFIVSLSSANWKNTQRN